MHTVLLKTACGAERRLEIPEMIDVIEIPYKSTRYTPWSVKSDFDKPDDLVTVLTRRFRFYSRVAHVYGVPFEAVYVEEVL